MLMMWSWNVDDDVIKILRLYPRSAVHGILNFEQMNLFIYLFIYLLIK